MLLQNPDARGASDDAAASEHDRKTAHVKKKRKGNYADIGYFDDYLQLFLLKEQKVNPRIHESFAKWRDANGPCIDWLDQQMDNPKRNERGYVKKSTIEALIDFYGQTVKTDPHYDYNDNITTLVMRHLVWREHNSGRPHRRLFKFKLSPKPKICPVCKEHNRAKARFCDQCGAEIPRKAITSETAASAAASAGDEATA